MHNDSNELEFRSDLITASQKEINHYNTIKLNHPSDNLSKGFGQNIKFSEDAGKKHIIFL